MTARDERFWSKVNKTKTCWLWTGTITRGYGVIQLDHRRWRAHRYTYEHLVGPIPAGLELDHLCRTPACVNPDHLEPVTHAENVRRGRSGEYGRGKTHCPQGHRYDAANTIVGNRGARRCRICSRAHEAAYRARRRQQRRHIELRAVAATSKTAGGAA